MMLLKLDFGQSSCYRDTLNQEIESCLRKWQALYLESRVYRIPRTPEMLAHHDPTVRERRSHAVTGTGIGPSPLNCRASTGTSENSPNRTVGVRTVARADS
jgi:hypothetical protein